MQARTRPIAARLASLSLILIVTFFVALQHAKAQGSGDNAVHDQPVGEIVHDQPVVQMHQEPSPAPPWLFSDTPPDTTPMLPCMTERDKTVLKLLVREWHDTDYALRDLLDFFNSPQWRELMLSSTLYFEQPAPPATMDHDPRLDVYTPENIRLVDSKIPPARLRARKARDRYHSYIRTILKRRCPDSFEPWWPINEPHQTEITDPGLVYEAVAPPIRGQIHVICQKCSPLADRYNNTVQSYNEAIRPAAQAHRDLSISLQADSVAYGAQPTNWKVIMQRDQEVQRAYNRVASAEQRMDQLRSQLDALLGQIIECEKSCGPAERTQATANLMPSSAPTSDTTKGAFDRCLVGTWRSESIVGLQGQRGGSGIVMTIKGDGTTTIDYNQMLSLEAEKGSIGQNNWWRGTASGHITTSNGKATIASVEKSEVSRKYTDPQGRTTTNPLSKLGPAAPGMYPPDNGYKCDKTTLTRKDAGLAFTFKREKREP